MVFLADKYDERKNALWFMLTYDATIDTWVHLLNMAWEHDECRGFTCSASYVASMGVGIVLIESEGLRHYRRHLLSSIDKLNNIRIYEVKYLIFITI